VLEEEILDQKSPGPPGWGLMHQDSSLLIDKKKIAKKPTGNTLDRCNPPQHNIRNRTQVPFKSKKNEGYFT